MRVQLRPRILRRGMSRYVTTQILEFHLTTELLLLLFVIVSQCLQDLYVIARTQLQLSSPINCNSGVAKGTALPVRLIQEDASL
jgi:hypothetical protein